MYEFNSRPLYFSKQSHFLINKSLKNPVTGSANTRAVPSNYQDISPIQEPITHKEPISYGFLSDLILLRNFRFSFLLVSVFQIPRI